MFCRLYDFAKAYQDVLVSIGKKERRSETGFAQAYHLWDRLKIKLGDTLITWGEKLKGCYSYSELSKEQT